MLKKILIAHRSEVALRIQSTCTTLGIKVVAIYTQDDELLSFVAHADEAYRLSLVGVAGYLNQDEIITIALAAGVDAIHPGYGFLAENATFAKKVVDAGILWIGPDPHVIDLMGDKIKARMLVEHLGVPTIPGFYISGLDVREVEHHIKQHDLYPLLIKNPLSGGGKAMRSVAQESDFMPALESITIESQRMGLDSSSLLVEKLLQHTRHIEIQVAGDGDQAIHLYERECSIQRRYQKVIEETPCNFISPTTLAAMYDCAVRITQSVQYKTVGTIEFILMPDETFYFLEMNTRLQVEHAVTELVTGIDLVALQVHVACGGKLGAQNTITRHGHALECRIYAEDPEHNFMPSTGLITGLHLPEGIFIRHEHDLQAGLHIRSFYDPMLSKLVTFGETRDAAIATMLDALGHYHIVGIKTNIRFLQAILASQEFISGNVTTQLLSNADYMNRMIQKMADNHDEFLYEIAQVAEIFLQELLVKHSASSNKSLASPWKNQQWR